MYITIEKNSINIEKLTDRQFALICEAVLSHFWETGDYGINEADRELIRESFEKVDIKSILDLASERRDLQEKVWSTLASSNSDINSRHACVHMHRGIGIYTLRERPAAGDKLGYLINHANFQGRYYDTVQSAMDDIDIWKR
ncbi:hypothetical protein [Desulfitobacterium chlororespirans]|uniref:Uncharacterized protein n=1 Tax=Desulfitobacterium chlororespirans DSM 11544 TaxID=1121395 RepID=A0A1M7UYI4_9FIRM|nr:hypothetical protein [Desulfitobacterium chlororespirans]SHN87987.1 hypothetical protein SAMN02745215_05068 [Desulfitobacterium chlororespirans DSM 11544]